MTQDDAELNQGIDVPQDELDVYDCRATDVLSTEQLIALGKVAPEWGMLEAALNSHASSLIRLPWQRVTGNPGGRRSAELLAE